MPDPAPKDLLKKLAGRKVQLSTRCGTFRMATGTIKETFDYFFLFVTVDEKFADQPPVRHWVWADNVAIVTEESKPAPSDDIQVTRYELS